MVCMYVKVEDELYDLLLQMMDKEQRLKDTVII